MCVQPVSVALSDNGLPNVLTLTYSACREKDVWGEDAQTFNPDRWLVSNGKRSSSVGVYSNLYVLLLHHGILMECLWMIRLTFAGGVRGCIGWRFA